MATEVRVRRALEIAVPLIAVALLALHAIALARYIADLPFGDDWRPYHLARAGSVDLDYLFAPENGTIYPAAKILDAIVYWLLGGNSTVYQILSLIGLVGCLALLQWKLLRRAVGTLFVLAAAAMIPMFGGDRYWGASNIASQQGIPLLGLLGILWIALRAKPVTPPWIAVILFLGVWAGFTHISGAVGILLSGTLLLIASIPAGSETRSLRLTGLAAFVAGAATLATQLYFVNGAGQGFAATVTSWQFWAYGLGEIAGGMLFVGFGSTAAVLTVDAIAAAAALFFAVLAATWSAWNVAHWRRRSAHVRRTSLVTLTVAAWIAMYIFLSASARAGLDSGPTFLEIFASGTEGHHTYWMTVGWPWLAASGLVVLRRRRLLARRPSLARWGRTAVAVTVIAAVLLMSLTNTFNYSGIYRNYVVLRDNVAQCISHALSDGTRAVCMSDRPWDLTTPVLEAMADGVSFGRYIKFGHDAADATAGRIDPASIAVADATEVVATADELSLTVTNDTVLTLMAPPAINLNDCEVVAVVASVRSTSQTVMSAHAAGLAEGARPLNSPVFVVPVKNPTIAATYLYAKTGFAGPVHINLSGSGRVSLTDIDVHCQVPIPTDDFVDEFDRALTTGWGASTLNDRPWITVGSSDHASVDGSSGVLSIDGNARSTFEYLPFRGEDVTLRARFSVDAIPASSIASVHLWPRVADSVSYRSYVVFKPGGDAMLTLAVAGLGRTARALTAKLADDAAPGDVWNVEVATDGFWPTSVYARAWRDGTPEPGSWTLQLVDSAVRLQVPADHVSIGLFGGSVSEPVTARFQNVEIHGRW